MEPTESGEGRSFRAGEFEGPLALLTDLIRKNGINIFDIPIADITEQYLDHLRRAENMDLDNVTEFHAMAAWLLLIKSRTLLPVQELDDDGEPVDPRQELVERLVEYQRFRKLSDLMEEKEQDAEWIVERRRLQQRLPFDDEALWEKADIWSLLKTFANIMRKLPGERILDMYEEVSVNEKVALMTELLEARGECLFSDLTVRPGRMEVVCAFMAVLEAVKVRMITIFQHRMFEDILIRKAVPGAPSAEGTEPAPDAAAGEGGADA